MLQQYICQTIFSDGSTYSNFILSSASKYLMLRQDFNNHPHWVGHLNEKAIKEKKYLLYFHNKYKVKKLIVQW
jgi:ribosomal protein L31